MQVNRKKTNAGSDSEISNILENKTEQNDELWIMMIVQQKH